jgi:hypothetical protein
VDYLLQKNMTTQLPTLLEYFPIMLNPDPLQDRVETMASSYFFQKEACSQVFHTLQSKQVSTSLNRVETSFHFNFGRSPTWGA